MINVEKVKPTGIFTNYIYKAIPLAFDESMSYYECLCGLLNYLKNTVMPALNNNADALAELQEFCIDLKDYVDHYFDNLDVQEEINNKLDEMAEQGQLTDIIAQYLQLAGVLAFNTLDDLENAENVVNGSICVILGKDTYNDGKMAYYKIRNIQNTDVVDGDELIAITNNNQLVGEKIHNFDIDTLKNDMYLRNNKKYLFIGDSYATGYQGSGIDRIEGYFTKVKNDLNLDATIVAEEGYGFMGMEGTHKWKTLLENTTINNKELYTDILICGGMNDRGTDSEFENAMSELFTYLKTNFPNATIHVGCVGRYSKSSEANLLAMRLVSSIYKYKTTKHGHKYIDGSELILHNMSWFIADTIHPNTYGEKQLAYGIEQYLLNGEINSFMSVDDLTDYQTDTIVSNDENITLSYVELYSNMTKETVNLYFNAQIDFTTAVTLNNLTDINIGTITNSYLCASPYNQGLDNIITGYVYNTNEINGSNFVKVDFRIWNDYNNDLHLVAFTVEDNGGVLSLNVTQIAFPYGPIHSQISSRYC